MRPFDIGPGVACDPDVLLNTRLLIQANSGAGKSWALRRLLEQTHGQVQQLVIDPEGEFATLRERYDYVLAAKTGGDTLADPRTAALLAERLLELGVSAVLDIYELKAHERVQFVRRVLEALVDAPKRLWHPVLVVLDEAHVFAPEKGSAESLQAVIDVATRGRKRGYCLVQATQRLSKLHKDAAAEMAKLTGPEQKLLRALLRHYPDAVSKETLGTECGYTNIRSGGFSEPLGRLNTLGIIRTPARGMVVAAPFLFLEGA